MRRPNLHIMSLTRLQNELVAAKAIARSCPCAVCRGWVDRVEEVLAAHEPKEAIPKKPDPRYDPLLLEMGIKKRRVTMTPTQRVAAGKRLAETVRFSNTVEGKKREQEKLDRLVWARGQTVRG